MPSIPPRALPRHAAFVLGAVLRARCVFAGVFPEALAAAAPACAPAASDRNASSARDAPHGRREFMSRALLVHRVSGAAPLIAQRPWSARAEPMASGV